MKLNYNISIRTERNQLMPALSPIEELRKHCEDYKAHLEADLERLARRYLPKEVLANYMTGERLNFTALISTQASGRPLIPQQHGADDVTPVDPILGNTIKKLTIVNKMLDELNNKNVDIKKRVENMANILNSRNQAILSIHRPSRPMSNFLHTILDILSRILNRDLRLKTTGQKLAEEIQKLKEQRSIKADKAAHLASSMPDKTKESVSDSDEGDGENRFYHSSPPEGDPADETTAVFVFNEDEHSNSAKKRPG